METPLKGMIINYKFDVADETIYVGFSKGNRMGRRQLLKVGNSLYQGEIYGCESAVVWRYPGETEWRR